MAQHFTTQAVSQFPLKGGSRPLPSFSHWPLRTLPSKHGSERPHIEYSAHVCDLTTLDLIPFRDEGCSCWGVCDHFVQYTHIVIVNEHLLEVNALDNGRQPFVCCEIIVGCVECVQWTLEDHIVLHEIPG